jgi:hypothetical protein
MENFSMLFNFLSRLNYFQIILLLLAMLIMFLGPVFVKKKYLYRLGLEKDERIENRNEWILYPKQYNFPEKSLCTRQKQLTH